MWLTDLHRIVIFHKEDSQGLLSNTKFPNFQQYQIYFECQIGQKKTAPFNYYYKIAIQGIRLVKKHLRGPRWLCRGCAGHGRATWSSKKKKKKMHLTTTTKDNEESSL